MVRERSAIDSLNRLKSLGFLTNKKEGKKYIHSTTQEGIQFLKIIETLREKVK